MWGWLALSVAVWAMASVLRPPGRPSVDRQVSSLHATLVVVGWAHAPVVGLAVVVLIAAGAMQLLGPGLVVAVVTLAVLFPFALVTGVRHLFALGSGRAVLAVAAPYIVWLLVVARHVLGQVRHLL